MKRRKGTLKRTAMLLADTQRIYMDNEMSVYAGYTTLYILMAMVPLLTLLIGVVNLLPDMSLQHFESAVQELLPNIPELRNMLHSIITNVNRKAGTLAISVSLIASLWSASNGVSAIQLALRKISGRGGSFFRRRAAALLYTLIFIALIPSLFIFRVLRGSIEQLIVLINHALNIPDIASRLVDFIEYSGVVTAFVMAVVILLAYSCLPGDHRKPRTQLPGTLFATVLWLAFSAVFEIFIERFWQASALYGPLASVFLAAMWLKTIMMILFYGAALNEAIHRSKGRAEEQQ